MQTPVSRNVMEVRDVLGRESEIGLTLDNTEIPDLLDEKPEQLDI